MLFYFRQLSLAAIAAFSIVALAGCGSKPKPAPAADRDHEHSEEMPETFSAAVADLQEHAPEIKEAFDAGKPADADEPLHHMVPLLEAMPKLIDASTLTPDQKAEAKEVSEQLLNEYEKLHDTSHDGGEAKYEDHAGKIDQALAKLVALAPAEDVRAEEQSVEKPAEELATDQPVAEPQADAPAAEEVQP
jgi:hypothetical protein